MLATPQREHEWLNKLVGEWTSEMECSMGPDQPTMTSRGVEVFRSLGGLWVVGEGEGEMPGGGTSKSIMTLGYNPVIKRYVGTFIASVMTHLWPYNGLLDDAEKVLSLDSEGPSFSGEGLAKYQDRIEFIDDDHRVMTSRVLGDDGDWTLFMTAHYRRKR